MMQIFPDPLTLNEQSHLDSLQVKVNAKPQGKARYHCAAGLWRNRKNKKAERKIWEEIERKLHEGGRISGLCHYCEYDRTAATEHFFPKKQFPELAFRWNNYLRICYRCNSTYKGDNFAVFNPSGSDTVVHLPITRGTYPSPPTDDAVLINPHTDNPQDFIKLDISTGIFLPIPGAHAREQAKATYTINLLHLNIDDNLLRYRRKALHNYLDKLDRYVKIKRAADFSSLLANLSVVDRAIVVQTNSFEQEQQRLLDKLKTDLLDDPFPVAWREIVTQRFYILKSMICSLPLLRLNYGETG